MKKSLFISVFMIMMFVTLSAAVPGKIPVQGTLMDKEGNLISDDAAQITFAIYDAETDGNELWKEERTLFIEKGKLAVYLGEISARSATLLGQLRSLPQSVLLHPPRWSHAQSSYCGTAPPGP